MIHILGDLRSKTNDANSGVIAFGHIIREDLLLNLFLCVAVFKWDSQTVGKRTLIDESLQSYIKNHQLELG